MMNTDEYNEYGYQDISEIVVTFCIDHNYIYRSSHIKRKDDKLFIHYSDKELKLKTIIDNDELTLKQKMKIVYQIGEAIAMLHSKSFCCNSIDIENVIGYYDDFYFNPQLIIHATSDLNKSQEELLKNVSKDVQDYKLLIFDILCPDVKDSYYATTKTGCKNREHDISVIVPYVPDKIKDFITRVCNNDKIVGILSSPEFDDIRNSNITNCNYISVKRNDKYELVVDNKGFDYRKGIKEIYCVYKDYLKSRYIDELFLAIDIYNRSFSLLEHGMSFQAYYCGCILLASKILGEDKLAIDDIRDAIHDITKSHPKREDVLSAELDIIVKLRGIVYTPYIYRECKNFKELYSILTFYILDKELYKDYHMFYDRLRNKHIIEGTMRGDTYFTCEEFFDKGDKLSDKEIDEIETFIG